MIYNNINQIQLAKNIIENEKKFLKALLPFRKENKTLFNLSDNYDFVEENEKKIENQTLNIITKITKKNINNMEQALGNNNVKLIKELINNHIENLIKQQKELQSTDKIVSKYARLTMADKENIIADAKEQMETTEGLNIKILAKKYNCSDTTIYNVINKYSKKGIRKK
jgi:Mor family transcriptional regulator